MPPGAAARHLALARQRVEYALPQRLGDERIDHAAHAAHRGLALRPTELIIFGNPAVGTALMQDEQTCGIDLPMKALAWQDASGSVWLTHNGMAWLGGRHRLGEKSAAAVREIEEMVVRSCRAAAGE